MRPTLAALHLLALAIGLGAVVVRARTARDTDRPERVRSALAADAWWGIAALLWLSTGLWRWLAGIEKDSAYYSSNPLFHAKLGLFVLIFLLELFPMITLIRWRRGRAPAAREGARIATISYVEAGIVVVMVFVATAMARGVGAD